MFIWAIKLFAHSDISGKILEFNGNVHMTAMQFRLKRIDRFHVIRHCRHVLGNKIYFHANLFHCLLQHGCRENPVYVCIIGPMRMSLLLKTTTQYGMRTAESTACRRWNPYKLFSDCRWCNIGPDFPQQKDSTHSPVKYNHVLVLGSCHKWVNPRE